MFIHCIKQVVYMYSIKPVRNGMHFNVQDIFSRFVRNLCKLTIMYCMKPIYIAIGYAQVLIPQNKSFFFQKKKKKENREKIKCKNKFSWKLVKNKFT